MANGAQHGGGITYFVRDVKTGRYFKENDVWVKDIAEAQGFPSEQEAVRFMKEHRERNLEVVIKC
jgi:hypothetical protein